MLEQDFEFDSVGAAIARELEKRAVEFVRETPNRCFFVSLVCGCSVVNSLVMDVSRCEISDNLWKGLPGELNSEKLWDRALSLCFLRRLKRQNHRAMKKMQEDGEAPRKIT
ncbi:hypothetical protein BT93_L0821 [Corymbia citriodora subsp. variegata]|uniref:Uncharacterized protein n=1 Tax=Corymbia citriodora subsp. variegata TaxID=360336 RepID=A0A8T0CP41_CORYI|nr:hypothetical protein BT93_L0821 [Corymbia citriodora subsp. variegata]